MGLARTSKNLIQSMEGTPETPSRIPPRMPKRDLQEHLKRISETIQELADRDLLTWLESNAEPEQKEIEQASITVADRMCGAISEAIIRSTREQNQLAGLKAWLDARGYTQVAPNKIVSLHELAPGTYAFGLKVKVRITLLMASVPVDCAIKFHGAGSGVLPIVIEAVCVGHMVDTEKRRKGDAEKYDQLVSTYGRDVKFLLLLCGYFEPGYLGFAASEGIDWVWEHRLNDLEALVSGPAGTTQT
jgi:type II restriction enzyme